MVKQNPDQRAYYTNLGNLPFLILCEPKLIKELSLNPRKFRKFNLYKHSKLSYDSGIFFSEDEKWAGIRGIIRHSFNHEHLKAMIPTMKKKIITYVDKLKEEIEGK